MKRWKDCPICAGAGQLAKERFANRRGKASDYTLSGGSVGSARATPRYNGSDMVASIQASNAEASGAIECRMPISLDSGTEPPSEIMVFPGGVHEITATQAGKPIRTQVSVDQSTAGILQASLETHRAAGPQKPFFDFDHKKEAASAWPLEFIWRQAPMPGVYARVEWSKAGAEAVQGKMYRAFSPSFYIDKQNPARVTGTPLDMGSLVNDPAFKKISPLWAKDASSESEGKNKKHMTPEELAALQARLNLLEKENAELKAKAASSENETDASRIGHINAKNEEIGQLKQELEKVQGEIKARNKATADAAVKAAVSRGVIAPKDEAVQAKWRGLIEADPSNEVLLANAPVNPALKPVTQPSAGIRASGVEISREDSHVVLAAYAKHYGAAISAKHGVSEEAIEAGNIYLRDIAPRINAGEAFPLILKSEANGAVQAANAPGTLVGRARHATRAGYSPVAVSIALAHLPGLFV
jgi:hypothetical protein